MFLQKVKRFFIRFSIYQIVLLWSFIKFNNVEKQAGDFKEKIMRNLGYFNMANKDIAEDLQDPIFLFTLSGLELIAGMFGLFGSFYGNFSSTVLFFISTVIYFNPLLPESQFSLYNIRGELFLNIGIFLSLCLCTYYPHIDEKTQGKVFQTALDEEDEEEEEEDETLQEDREEKVHDKHTKNKKKKKKII